MVRKMGFARFLRDQKLNKTKIWCFVGSDGALVNMGSQRLIKQIGWPVRRVQGKLSAVGVGHVMGELELVADRWVMVLDDAKKVDRFEAFKRMVAETLGDNYIIILASEKADEEFLDWAGNVGKVVNCDKVENRRDLMEILENIFADANIRLASQAGQAVMNLSGFSVGPLRNAARLLRMYYDPEGGPLELDYSDVVKVVPALNYEDVFAVVSEVLYGRMATAVDYYQKLSDREDVQWLFLDRLLSIFRDLWVYSRLGELGLEQQEDLGLDSRTYAKIGALTPPSEEMLSRIYRLVLDVYGSTKRAADQDFVVESLLVFVIRILRGEDVGRFPTTKASAKA